MLFNDRMALTVRNGLLTMTLGILALLILGYAGLLFVLVSREGWTASVGRETLLQLTLNTAIAPVGALAAHWLTRRAYRKSGSPEAFFFALFAASLAGEALLLGQGWLQSAAPAVFTAILTRAVWAFRLTGLFLLFCGSLFTLDFAFRKYGNLVLVSAVAGVLVASWLPLHAVAPHAPLQINEGSGVRLVTLVLGAVVVLNFVLGAVRNPSAERVAQVGAVILFLASWAVVCLWSPWGISLAVAGALLAFWKTEQTILV